MIAGFDKKGDPVCWTLEIERFVLPSITDSQNVVFKGYNAIRIQNVGNETYMMDGGWTLPPGSTDVFGSSNDLNKVIFDHTFKLTGCKIETDNECCNGPKLQFMGIKTRICGCVPCPTK